MAGMGPPPAENRVRRNADTFGSDRTTVVADGRMRGPALKGEYAAATREWWNTWRKSAQAQTFAPTDWQRLKMLLPLVEAFHTTSDPQLMVKLLTEIRQSESLLGATPMDRLRGRVSVQQAPPPARRKPAAPDPAAPAAVSSLDDRRARLANG